jgi:hypothetical protein
VIASKGIVTLIKVETSITAGTPFWFQYSGNENFPERHCSSEQHYPFNATIGQNLQQAVNLTLSAPVSSATQVTVTSNDPSRLKFSTAPDVAGSPSIMLTIPINQSNTADFYALRDSRTPEPSDTPSPRAGLAR